MYFAITGNRFFPACNKKNIEIMRCTPIQALKFELRFFFNEGLSPPKVSADYQKNSK